MRRRHRRADAALKTAAVGASFEALCELLNAELILSMEPWGPAGIAYERRQREARIAVLVEKLREYLLLCTDPEEPPWVERLRAIVRLYDERARERKPKRRRGHALDWCL